MKNKKLMILGGTRYAIPLIKRAHELGIYVITCDYLPDNIAHKYSDKFCDASVIDKDAVLDYAIKENIDGIVSFACDPGVVSAAYVAEKLNIPFQGPYESVNILQDKGLFREFLIDNGFNSPKAKRYSSIDEAITDYDKLVFPVIVKPVDSAGSKGVTKVNSIGEIEDAIKTAVNTSNSKAFIIEEFLEFKGYHSSTDVFTVDGKVKFITFSDQMFDHEADNPYTPSKIIWPSSMECEDQNYLAGEIQRLMTLLNMRTGIYNIETCVGSNGKPYIMEVSPRGGGCKIAELQKLAYGVDLIDEEIRNAVGLPNGKIVQSECDGFWCEMVIHSGKSESGIFERIEIDPEINDKYVKMVELSVKKGDVVHPFTGANMALGDMFLRFDSREQLDDVTNKYKEWLRIVAD